MVRYIYKTKDRQGEYTKPEYDGKEAINGWNLTDSLLIE